MPFTTTTTAPALPAQPDAWSLAIATRTLWGEARGEPPEGQLAVAWVLRNRLAAGRWGRTLASVCLAPLQFSCWNARDANRPQMAALVEGDPGLAPCISALQAALSGQILDPTGGATHYAVAGTPAPWLTSGTPTARIGHHQFYRDVP